MKWILIKVSGHEVEAGGHRKTPVPQECWISVDESLYLNL
jgi:hypothetical protein